MQLTTPLSPPGDNVPDVTSGQTPYPPRAELDDSVIARWALTGLPGRLDVASYLTEPHAPLYRLIVDVLLERQRTSLTGVGRDELANLLARRAEGNGSDAVNLLAATDLSARMAQLHAWGVVDVWQDRAVRDEDFLRNRDRYQLTAVAAALHRAISALSEEGISSIAAVLAPAVLARELAQFSSTLSSDTVAALESWSVLHNTTDAMARAAAVWQSGLAAALAGTPTAEKVATARETITRYVEMWGAGVDTHSGRIEQHLDAIAEIGPAAWRRAALASAGSDADETRITAEEADLRATLALIANWFIGQHAQAPALRSQMASAVAPMIRSQRTIAAVGGHVSRRRELLGLAARLDAAPDDDASWDVWCPATGLFSAAHHHTSSAEPHTGTPSFWIAQPAPVEARLRTHGPRALTGRPANMPDRSEARRRGRASAAAEAEANARLRHDLLGLSGRALSDMPALPTGHGLALIDILAVLAGPMHRRASPLTAETPDGVWHVRAEPLPGHAVLRVGDGRLVHPDLRLHLELAGGSQ